MRLRPRQGGFAMLAALVIMTLAGVFAAACVAAVSARQHVSRADHAGQAADEAAHEVLTRLCLRLWRSPAQQWWSASGRCVAADSAAWEALCAPVVSDVNPMWPRVSLETEVTTPAAARRLKAVVELEALPQAQGVVVAHDVEAQAPLTIQGGGLYSGGSVRGREWIAFAADGGGAASPVDGVHGDVWPTAAVHALGGVWASGAEIHAGGTPDPRFASDTDVHTGAGVVAALTREPDLTTLAALQEMTVPPAGALVGGVLDLAQLPLASAGLAGSSEEADGGYVVVVPPQGDTATLVVGARCPGGCPIVLVLEGDAVLGRAGTETRLDGAVVACRDLEIAGPATVTGHLYAAGMTVAAPLSITTPAAWRSHPLPGLVQPVVIALGR